MRKPIRALFAAGVLAVAIAFAFQIGFRNEARVSAQSAFPDPANEHACPSQTGAGGGAEAIPAFVGTGGNGYSPNQSLCLPQFAPVGNSADTFAFIVGGGEPSDRVDSQGTVYVASIRGVPGGIDMWRWDASIDGAPNKNGTLPFKYEGQPDNCGIFGLSGGGCANNVGSTTDFGVAPGGGDADIAVNAPDPNNSAIPNVAITSLTLAPGVTSTRSPDRADNFITPPNVVASLIPGNDRMWNDALADPLTVFVNYHDLATFNINVQRSSDGGFTYAAGAGEGIDANTLPAAGSVAPTDTGNTAAQIKVDHSSCPSGGNLYVLFTAPDNATENTNTGPQRTVYVGVSKDAKLNESTFTFTDYKVFTSPQGSLAAIHGANNIFSALAVDNFGYIYAAWSDNSNIFMASSANEGATWTAPVRVNSGTTVGKANVFPGWRRTPTATLLSPGSAPAWREIRMTLRLCRRRALTEQSTAGRSGTSTPRKRLTATMLRRNSCSARPAIMSFILAPSAPMARDAAMATAAASQIFSRSRLIRSIALISLTPTTTCQARCAPRKARGTAPAAIRKHSAKVCRTSPMS